MQKFYWPDFQSVGEEMFIYIQAIHNLEGIPQRVYFKAFEGRVYVIGWP